MWRCSSGFSVRAAAACSSVPLSWRPWLAGMTRCLPVPAVVQVWAATFHGQAHPRSVSLRVWHKRSGACARSKVRFWQPAVRHNHPPRAWINILRAPASECDARTTRCLSAHLARRRIFTRFCRLSSVARLPPQLCPRARILRDRTATTDRQGPIAASVRKGDRACALGSGAVLAVVNACTCLPVTSSCWCLQPASLDPNNHLLPQWGHLESLPAILNTP